MEPAGAAVKWDQGLARRIRTAESVDGRRADTLLKEGTADGNSAGPPQAPLRMHHVIGATMKRERFG